MNNRANDARDINQEAGAQRHKIGLPLVALGLVLLPFLLYFIGASRIAVTPAYSLFVILCPIVGLITGIFALSQGRRRIGLAGKIIAIAAVALPLAFVALVLVVFIGATTGIISLM